MSTSSTSRMKRIVARRVRQKLAKRKLARSLKVHSFSRNARQSFIDLAADAAFPTWKPESFTFQLSDVINVSDFSNLFDQFKIDKVEMTLRWSPNDGVYNSSNNLAATGVYNPVLYYCKDYDDAIDISSLNNMLEIQKHKSVRLVPGKPIYITVKPAVQSMMYKTIATTAYGPKWDVKLNMNDDATPHMGLKIGVSKIDNNFGKITIDTKYYFTCYGVQ